MYFAPYPFLIHILIFAFCFFLMQEVKEYMGRFSVADIAISKRLKHGQCTRDLYFIYLFILNKMCDNTFILFLRND